MPRRTLTDAEVAYLTALRRNNLLYKSIRERMIDAGFTGMDFIGLGTTLMVEGLVAEVKGDVKRQVLEDVKRQFIKDTMEADLAADLLREAASKGEKDD